MSAEPMPLPQIYMIQDADRDLRRIGKLLRQKDSTRQWLEQQMQSIDTEIEMLESSLYAFGHQARQVTGKATIPLASGRLRMTASRNRVEKLPEYYLWAEKTLVEPRFWKRTLVESEAWLRVKWSDDGRAYDRVTGEEIPGLGKLKPEKPFSLSYEMNGNEGGK